MSEIEKRLEKIEQRNQKVERDKAWETSWVRRISICVLTFLVVLAYNAMVTNFSNIFLNSAVPVIGFLLSTLSLDLIRSIYERNKR
ncbi:MAG: hypothetical protein ACK5MU_03320 [Candidatus Saccharimonadales bacterium]